ncbi:hypothetical protein [Pseudomonas cichorii]|uniref:hypothetical protein n=1 Tax=Pseudomonas cichorii TaxID=36746 RepID=UPI0011C3FE75|nr:hypothetical protein [Pseudomonas cichorii]
MAMSLKVSRRSQTPHFLVELSASGVCSKLLTAISLDHDSPVSAWGIVTMDVLKQQPCTKFKIIEKKCEISVFTWSFTHNLMILFGLFFSTKSTLRRPVNGRLRVAKQKMLLMAPAFE